MDRNILQRTLTLTLGVLLLAVLPSSAQVYYSCNFEDSIQAASWHCNYTLDPNVAAATARELSADTANVARIPNHWYIGELGNFDVQKGKGLYISSDGGASAVYNSVEATSIVAYDTLTLAPGTYALDFDWRLMGNGSSTKLYVAWVPRSVRTPSHPTSGASNWFTQQYIVGQACYGHRTWTPQRFTFTVTQATSVGKLCFIFATAKDGAKPTPPAACVDNIEIHSSATCGKPLNLKYNESQAKLTWGGSGSLYQVRDYCAYEDLLFFHDSLTTTNLSLQLSGEGMHVFYVRTVCGEGQYSEWVSTSQFVWIPGARCLDYMDLSNPAVCVCYTGQAESTNYNAFATPGLPVMGVAGNWKTGQHTMHTNPEEYDPQTENMLPTVPEGELMSIRLGNSTSGSGAEGIVYRMTIPKGESRILKLKYALVLNYASYHDAGGPESGPHGTNEQSHFYVEIRDQNGRPQGQGCSTFDFSADPDPTNLGPDWHVVAADEVVWKEWTEASISLVEFSGQTIQIRLSNYDCTASGHWGYAYFAMACEDGGLQGVACGDFSTDHFEAPEGFDYRWYAEADPQHRTLSTDRIFNISPSTDSIYHVEVISKENGCYYTLVANPNPRFPLAKGDTIRVSRNCQHNITFVNKSVIRVVNRVSGETMSNDEDLYTVEMDYGDGVHEKVTGSSFTHTYPSTGGHFVAHMIASMSDGICQDTLTYEFDLPDMVHTGSTKEVHLCNGQSYTFPFNGRIVTENAVDSTMSANHYGCLAPDYTYVYFHDVLRDTTNLHICEGAYVEFEGKKYFRETFDSAHYVSAWGCDSVHYLMLTMTDTLSVEVPSAVTICGDDAFAVVDYSILKGELDSVTVSCGEDLQKQGFAPSYTFAVGEEVAIPVPDSIVPNRYELQLTWQTPECGVDPIKIMLDVLYPNTVFDQKNGVVALMNADYNGGGYEWVSYQWYRNGEIMLGDTASYILVSDLHDMGAEFTVEVIRADDGVVTTTCPIRYVGGKTALDDMIAELVLSPTLCHAGESIKTNISGVANVYDPLGRLVARYADSSQLVAPSMKGVYIISINHLKQRILVR